MQNTYIQTSQFTHCAPVQGVPAGCYGACRNHTINNQKDYILEELYKKARRTLFRAIWNIDYVTDIAREYKKLCPSVPIWVGGPEVSYEWRHFCGKIHT